MSRYRKVGRGARSWRELTTKEQAHLVAGYYGLVGDRIEPSARMRVQAIIDRYDLDATRNEFTSYLPGISGRTNCEACGKPVELRPLTSTEFLAVSDGLVTGTTDKKECFYISPPGLEMVLPYRLSVVKACDACGHKRGNNCYCRYCRAQRLKTASTSAAVSVDHALVSRIQRRIRLENDPAVRLMPWEQLFALARQLICGFGIIAPDGGLWVLLQDEQTIDGLGLGPVDGHLVMAAMQAQGLARQATIVEPGQTIARALTTYLITASPSRLLELGVIARETYNTWQDLRNRLECDFPNLFHGAHR